MTLPELFELFSHHAGLWAGVVFVFALLIGSFLNVVIYRLPVMMQLEWMDASREFVEEGWGELPDTLKQHPKHLPTAPFNLSTPRSRCRHCQHMIRWYENIPLISYAALKGRCSACKTPISVRYPLIEFITATLSAWVAFRLGVSSDTAWVLCLTWALIAMTMIDFDHKLLPDQLTLPLLWMGLLINLDGQFVPLDEAVIGAAAGYLSLWSIFWIFKLVTGKEGMGHGDFKLLAALGAWMGWKVLPVIILMSSLVGSIIGLAMILVMGRDKQIPIAFGPYLAIAGWITFFWGPTIMQALYP